MAKIEGVITALLTPFDKGDVDFKSLENLVEFQLKNNVKSLVVLGTTAENVLLTENQQFEVLRFVTKKCQNAASIFAGVGTPSTQKTVQNALKAVEIGVEGLLVVAPYYIKSTQEGLYRHFQAVKDATNLPVIAYNVPHRTGYEFDIFVLKKLLEKGKISALKEATNDVNRIAEIAEKLPSLPLLCGNDSLLSTFKKLPSTTGFVSVVSNCLPALTVSAFGGDKQACQIVDEFSTALGCEASPVAAKYLAFKLGLIKTAEMRLPLTQLDVQKQQRLDILVEKYKDIILAK